MTRVASVPAWLLIGLALGIAAGLAAVRPSAVSVSLVAGPLALVALWWWAISGPDRWLAAFLGTALLTPPLPLPLGDTGPHVSLLFAAFGLWAGAARLGSWRIGANSLTLSAVLFFFVLLLSVPLAALYSGVAVAAGSLARVLLFGISLYIFFYVAYGPGSRDRTTVERAIRLLFWAGALSALFACVDFYFQLPAPAGFAQQFVWSPGGVYRRAQGVFYEAGALGNLCACFLVLVAAAWLRPSGNTAPLSRPGLLIGGVVFSVALLFSFSRSSLLNFAVALVVMTFLHRGRFRWRRIGVWFTVSVLCGLAISYLLFATVMESYLLRLWATSLEIFTEPEAMLAGRAESWKALAAFLSQNPWHALLGIGYKTLPYSDFIGQKIVADNMYISVLAETGLVGLGAMLAFHAAILRAAYRAARHADAAVSLPGTWIFCFWAGQMFQMLSADILTYWRILPVYFYVLALAVGGAQRART